MSYFAGDNARDVHENDAGNESRNEFGNKFWYSAGHRSRSGLRSRLR